jgi:hypothetical protein
MPTFYDTGSLTLNACDFASASYRWKLPVHTCMRTLECEMYKHHWRSNVWTSVKFNIVTSQRKGMTLCDIYLIPDMLLLIVFKLNSVDIFMWGFLCSWCLHNDWCVIVKYSTNTPRRVNYDIDSVKYMKTCNLSMILRNLLFCLQHVQQIQKIKDLFYRKLSRIPCGRRDFKSILTRSTSSGCGSHQLSWIFG